MTCELSVVDCFGHTVVLEHSNWERHWRDARHPEVVPYHDRFPEVLQDPDIVTVVPREGEPDGQWHFHRRGIGEGRYLDYFLVLIVGRYGETLTVTTWRFVRESQVKGNPLWIR